jgi:hydroxyacylglutathione hydrolase
MSIDIFPIPINFDTVYLVRGNRLIVIDGGDPGHFVKFINGIKKYSIDPKDIKLIVLTHGHWDHIGLTKEIQDISGSRILMNQQDIPLIDDIPPSQPPGFTIWGKIIIELLKLATRSVRIPQFSVSVETGDEDISLAEYGIPGTVVHTPGHSPGSVSIVLECGEVFVGDLAMNMFPMRMSPGLPIFGYDMQIVKNSWRKLLAMGVRTVYPAHGKPFSAEIMKKAVG